LFAERSALGGESVFDEVESLLAVVRLQVKNDAYRVSLQIELHLQDLLQREDVEVVVVHYQYIKALARVFCLHLGTYQLKILIQ
jgi:hypothetical protein